MQTTHQFQCVDEVVGLNFDPSADLSTPDEAQIKPRDVVARDDASANKAIKHLHHRLQIRSAVELVILDAAKSDDAKTKALAAKVAHLGWAKPLVIDGPEVDANFVRAAKNIEGMAVLPSQGANVYDILNHRTLVLTKAGIEALEARLA